MQNLVKNPSFESDSNKDGIPDDWQPFDLRTDRRTVEYLHGDRIAHTGKYAIKISRGVIYGEVTGVGAWAQKRVVDNGAGKTFTLSTYARASQPTRVRLHLFGNDPNWATILMAPLRKSSR